MRNNNDMLWIVGPCSVESRDYFLKAADFLVPAFKVENFILRVLLIRQTVLPLMESAVQV